MSQEEIQKVKSAIADAFASLHFAGDICLSEKEIKNISYCLRELNEYLSNERAEDCLSVGDTGIKVGDIACFYGEDIFDCNLIKRTSGISEDIWNERCLYIEIRDYSMWPVVKVQTMKQVAMNEGLIVVFVLEENPYTCELHQLAEVSDCVFHVSRKGMEPVVETIKHR